MNQTKIELACLAQLTAQGISVDEEECLIDIEQGYSDNSINVTLILRADSSWIAQEWAELHLSSELKVLECRVLRRAGDGTIELAHH